MEQMAFTEVLPDVYSFKAKTKYGKVVRRKQLFVQGKKEYKVHLQQNIHVDLLASNDFV